MADISHAGMWNRLEKAGPWLQKMALSLLNEQAAQLREQGPAKRVVDGSRIRAEHAKSAENTFLLHACVDGPSEMSVSLELTPLKNGETLKRFKVQPGDLLVADRGFAHVGPICEVLEKQADVVVRMKADSNPHLLVEGAKPWSIDMAEEALSEAGESHEWRVCLRCPKDPARIYEGRLVAMKKDEEHVQREIKRQKEAARTDGRPFSQTAQRGCGFTLVFTSLGAAYGAQEILDLYRNRWAIEIFFRNFKQITQVERKMFRKPAMAQAWIWGKILLFLLVEKTRRMAGDFSPEDEGTRVA